MLACLLLAAATTTVSPNILVVVVDDLGIDKVGSYEEGQDIPPTPRMDALAGSGVRFTRAYSMPVCSSTRAAMLTGRYPFRTGVGWYISPGVRAALPLEEVTIPEVLDEHESGYDHAAVGKWHLASPHDAWPLHPVWSGFRQFSGTLGNIDDYYLWPKICAHRSGFSSVHLTATYATTETTDDAMRLIHSMREPWFLWVGYHAPHDPFHDPPPKLHHQVITNARSQFRAMVEALDTEFGRLMSAVDLRNTTVILVGDNGTTGVMSDHPVSRAKGTLYEGGVNVPLIVAGAGIPQGEQGKVSEALVCLTDIFATVIELAGLDPERAVADDVLLDSRSFVSCLRRPEGSSPRDTLFAEHFRPLPPSPANRHRVMITDGRYKLIRDLLQPHPFFDSLFDLDSAPPGEDGRNYCPCVALPEELAEGYEKLVMALNAVIDNEVPLVAHSR
jgi:arylsulfatase A-like enzyme